MDILGSVTSQVRSVMDTLRSVTSLVRSVMDILGSVTSQVRSVMDTLRSMTSLVRSVRKDSVPVISDTHCITCDLIDVWSAGQSHAGCLKLSNCLKPWHWMIRTLTRRYAHHCQRFMAGINVEHHPAWPVIYGSRCLGHPGIKKHPCSCTYSYLNTLQAGLSNSNESSWFHIIREKAHNEYMEDNVIEGNSRVQIKIINCGAQKWSKDMVSWRICWCLPATFFRGICVVFATG